MAESLLMIGINKLVSAALWGLGTLFCKKRSSTVGEIQDRDVQITSYGAVKPILYGQCKVATELIYAEKLIPYKTDQGIPGGKGATTERTYYLAIFAGIFGVAPDPEVFGEFKLLKVWKIWIFKPRFEGKILRQSLIGRPVVTW